MFSLFVTISKKNITNPNTRHSFWTSNISNIGQGTKSFLSLQSCASRIAQYAIYTWSKKHHFINCLPFRIRVDDYKKTYLLKKRKLIFSSTCPHTLFPGRLIDILLTHTATLYRYLLKDVIIAVKHNTQRCIFTGMQCSLLWSS